MFRTLFTRGIEQGLLDVGATVEVGVVDLLSCDVTSDDCTRITGGYFQNGRNAKVLEGNDRTTCICLLRVYMRLPMHTIG